MARGDKAITLQVDEANASVTIRGDGRVQVNLPTNQGRIVREYQKSAIGTSAQRTGLNGWLLALVNQAFSDEGVSQ